jgi:hypothetical protein
MGKETICGYCVWLRLTAHPAVCVLTRTFVICVIYRTTESKRMGLEHKELTQNFSTTIRRGEVGGLHGLWAWAW